MKPRVGQTLVSTVDATTVVVVRWPEKDLEVTCGGAAMVDPRGAEAGATGTPDPSQLGGSQLGSATRTRNSAWKCSARSRGRARWR